MIRQQDLALGDYVMYKNVICVVKRLTSVHATIMPVEPFIGKQQGELLLAEYTDLRHVKLSENILKCLGFTFKGQDNDNTGYAKLVDLYNSWEIVILMRDHYMRIDSEHQGYKYKGYIYTYCFDLNKLQRIASIFGIKLELNTQRINKI